MKILLLIVFVLLSIGLFELLSGLFRLPTLRTSRAMMDTAREDKKLSKTVDALYMDGAVRLSGSIKINDYKRSRMNNMLRASGLGMTPEVYMAYAYLKAGSLFILVISALHIFPLIAILLVPLGVMVYYRETRKAEEMLREKREQIEGELYRFTSTITQELKTAGMYYPCWNITRKMQEKCSEGSWISYVRICVPAAMRQRLQGLRHALIHRSFQMW